MSKILSAETPNAVNVMVAETSEPMRTRHFIGDAMTAVSTNIIFNVLGMMIYFYTDVIGLAAGAVGTILLVTKLADAFTDIAMGAVVEKTNTKYGKARPWLIRMALPSLIGLVLLFTIPANSSVGIKLAYAAVSNILICAGICTAISVPFSCLLSFETKNPLERAKMGIWRLVFAYAAGSSVSILLIPAANNMGGDQKAWVEVGAIFGIVSAITLVVAFFSVREKNIIQLREKENEVPLLEGLKLLFRNKYWVIALVVNILINVIFALANGAVVYYAKYIFGDENLVAIMGLVNLGFVALGFVLSGSLIKKFGKRNIALIGSAVAIVGGLLRIINPYNFVFNLITIGMTTLGGIPVLAVIGALIADTIEYGEWKTGKRTVGLASSANSFGAKAASGIWSGMIGWLLALSGYNGMNPTQTPIANQMIMILNIHVPLVCFIAIFIIMLFYTLDKNYDSIVSELEIRRQKAIYTR